MTNVVVCNRKGEEGDEEILFEDVCGRCGHEVSVPPKITDALAMDFVCVPCIQVLKKSGMVTSLDVDKENGENNG